jgi:hypothetical protein
MVWLLRAIAANVFALLWLLLGIFWLFLGIRR